MGRQQRQHHHRRHHRQQGEYDEGDQARHAEGQLLWLSHAGVDVPAGRPRRQPPGRVHSLLVAAADGPPERSRHRRVGHLEGQPRRRDAAREGLGYYPPAAVTAANILKGNGNANEPFVAPTAAFEPALAKLLQALSIIGLLEQMLGQGLFLTESDINFRLDDDQYIIDRASFFGPSLGFSLDGYLDRDDRLLDFQGVFSCLLYTSPSPRDS